MLCDIKPYETINSVISEFGPTYYLQHAQQCMHVRFSSVFQHLVKDRDGSKTLFYSENEVDETKQEFGASYGPHNSTYERLVQLSKAAESTSWNQLPNKNEQQNWSS